MLLWRTDPIPQAHETAYVAGSAYGYIDLCILILDLGYIKSYSADSIDMYS